MKILISLLMFMFLQTGLTPDPHANDKQYLLVYMARTAGNNNIILTGSYSYASSQEPTTTLDRYFGPNMAHVGVDFDNVSGRTSQWKTFSDTIENRSQIFATLQNLKDFVNYHTIHYSDGIETMPWDFEITSIEGVYLLTPLEFNKVKVGTHREYVQETKEVDVPSYEWRIK